MRRPKSWRIRINTKRVQNIDSVPYSTLFQGADTASTGDGIDDLSAPFGYPN